MKGRKTIIFHAGAERGVRVRLLYNHRYGHWRKPAVIGMDGVGGIDVADLRPTCAVYVLHPDS
jgi:hypothetical protein